jgi:hypothetical protein
MRWGSSAVEPVVGMNGIRSLRLLALPAVLTALALATGCEPKSRDLQPGMYRAVVELPGGDVPFGLDVVAGKDGIALYLVNGTERMRVPAFKAVPGELTAELAGTGNALTAQVSGDELDGKVTLADRDGGNSVLPFSAVRGQDWRFVEEPRSDNADFSGRWSYTFTDDAGHTTHGIAEFKQSFHAVSGSVRTATWTQEPLAGDADDEELSLSLFDGQQAVLYRGELDESGHLVGECWSTASGHLRYTALRNPDATL